MVEDVWEDQLFLTEGEAVRALALLEKEELRQKIRKLQAELDRLA